MGYEDEKLIEAFIAHFQKTIKMTFKKEVDFMLQMKSWNGLTTQFLCPKTDKLKP
jgi:hypothetical protein